MIKKIKVECMVSYKDKEAGEYRSANISVTFSNLEEPEEAMPDIEAKYVNMVANSLLPCNPKLAAYALKRVTITSV